MTSMKPKAARSPRERVNRSPEHRAMLRLIRAHQRDAKAAQELRLTVQASFARLAAMLTRIESRLPAAMTDEEAPLLRALRRADRR